MDTSRLKRLDPEGWARLSELADRAFEQPPERLADFVDRACQGDPELRADLQALIDSDRAAERFLEPSPLDAKLLERPAEEEEAEADLGGARVGAWRLVREIGRGGMGAVYLAERADGAFQQRVALKLVRRGLDTDEILERFLRERRILARLEHPHIARLVDGGVSGDGRPWFAMEYVDGEPITAWCDARAADLDLRLRLFRAVCAAVQHAHRALIVHRDLKPSNVFVTDAGEVKLLDFGIAQMLADETGREVTLTQAGRRLFTPQYAAPEQIRGEPTTTSTDVYSLGVLLYELLAGQRPYARGVRLPAEVERAALEEEPMRPSEARREWRGRLRGDLDHIVSMALRKEPARRYPSVEALLADLERHRDGLPVSAARPSPFDRLRKFVRRHRPAVLAGTAILVTILAAAIVALWQALAAALLVASLSGGLAVAIWQARSARRQARKAEEVRRFLVGVFEVSDPSQSRGQTVTARELLERGARRVESELRREPALRAEIMGLLGDLHVKLGLVEPGLALVERELELLSAMPRSRPRDRAGALRRRGDLLLLKGDWGGAEAALREAADLHRASVGETSSEYAEDLDQLATALHFRARREESEALQRRSLEIRRRLYGDDHPALAHALNNLAVIAREAGRLEESEALYRECLRIRRKYLPPDHPDFCATLINLTALLRQRGRYLEAEQIARESLELHRKLYGENHVTVGAVNALGAVMISLARWSEAEALFREALVYWEAHGGRDHPNAIATLNNLARSVTELGRLDEGLALQQEAVERWRRLLGDRHPFLASGLLNLATVLRARGDLASADRTLAEAHEILRSAHGDDHPEVANVLYHRGLVAEQNGNLERAEGWFRTALLVRDQHLGADSHPAAACRARLAGVLGRRGCLGEARPLAAEAVAVLRRVLPSGHPDLLAADRVASEIEPHGARDPALRPHRGGLQNEGDSSPPPGV